jgi:TATA-box binding protein (TBP) (component of TFIID and TFIIIB)
MGKDGKTRQCVMTRDECDGLKYSFRIVNVTATYKLGFEVDLPRLSKQLEGMEYFPETFSGCAFIKTPRMKGKVMVWRTGVLTSVGTNTSRDAEADINYVLKRMSELMVIENK